MPNKKNDINKVIDGITNVTKKAVEEVSKSITKENVNKTAKDLKDKVETIVDNGEKIVIEAKKKVKKNTLKPELFIEFDCKQIAYEQILKKVYTELESKMDMLKIKSVKLYYKVEENRVYCVVNKKETIIIEL